MNLNKEKVTIAFSGPRPQKLGGFSKNNPTILMIEKQLIKVVQRIIQVNPLAKEFEIVTGGALGIDQTSFKVGEIIKEQQPELNLIQHLAIPYLEQASAWYDYQKVFYEEMLQKCDMKTYVDTLVKYQIVRKGTPLPVGKHDNGKLQLRNQFMVDVADILIAVWQEGQEGGTFNCVQYANKQNINIILINPNNGSVSIYKKVA